MKPGIIEGMNRIHELARQIQRRDEEREDLEREAQKGSDYSYEDEAPRYRDKPLKRNKVYSEADLEKFNDDRERAASINDNQRGLV